MKYVVLIDIWRKNEKKIIVRHLNVAIFIFSRENSEFNGKFHLVILQLAYYSLIKSYLLEDISFAQ